MCSERCLSYRVETKKGEALFRLPPSVSSCCLSFPVRSAPFPGHVLAEEFAHQPGDGVALLFQGEVPGVEQVELQRLQVTSCTARPRPAGKIWSFLPQTISIGG